MGVLCWHLWIVLGTWRATYWGRKVDELRTITFGDRTVDELNLLGRTKIDSGEEGIVPGRTQREIE